MDAEEAGPDARVVFELTVEDGWPPAASERVWAFHVGGDHYRIDNAPWFVPDLAVGDVVKAVAPDAESHPVFVELVERSQHITIRLVCFRSGPLEGDLVRALQPFTALGVYGEGMTQYGMLALDIEPTAPLAAIASTLRRGVADGSWEYEEGRITQAWVEATQTPAIRMRRVGERRTAPWGRRRPEYEIVIMSGDAELFNGRTTTPSSVLVSQGRVHTTDAWDWISAADAAYTPRADSWITGV